MSENKSENKNLIQEVMNKIERGEVKMKPRIRFVLGSIFLGAGVAGALTVAVFFFNLAFFRLRSAGPCGLRLFLTTFPWAVAFVASIAVIVGIILLRRHEISYKKSFLGLVVGLVTLILTTAFLLDRVGFNERVGKHRWARPFYNRQLYNRQRFR